MRIESHIDSLIIRRFKAFSEMSLSEFGAFNVLMGANDTGKTSLLEALFLLTGLSNSQLPIVVQNHRHLAVQDSQAFSYLFHKLNVRSPVEMSARSKGLGETRLLKIHARHLGKNALLSGKKGRSSGNGGTSEYFQVEGDSDKQFLQCLIQHMALQSIQVMSIGGGISAIQKVAP